nr:immunoglobulin light chain junction region [Macaca mulatta]
CQQTSNPPLTF